MSSVATEPGRSDPQRSESQLAEALHRIPLRTRLITILVALVGIALLMTSILATLLLRSFMMGQMDRDLRSQALPIAQSAIGSVYDSPYGMASDYRPPTNYAVSFYQPSTKQQAIYAPRAGLASGPRIPPMEFDDPRVRRGTPFTVASTNDATRWRVIGGAMNDGSMTFAVALPLSGVDDTVDRMAWLTGGLSATLLLTSAILGWYAVRRAFRPLREIEDTAAAIADGDLSRRISARDSDDEVASLAGSLNAMLAHIESSFAVRERSEERMARFVADASHELRTPLAAIRGYAELYRQGAVRDPEQLGTVMGRIEGEAVRMGELVEDMLTLTRLDGQRPMRIEPVDLTVIAADAVADARAQAPGRTISLMGLGAPLAPTVTDGDESRLRQVLTNLLANALAHTPAGTPVEVQVGMPGDAASVRVVDHGQGVPPGQRDKVFERFFRADPARTRATGGTGLGLAIVHAIVTAHHGRISLAETPGGGATFQIDLPRAEPAPSVNSQATPSDD